MEDGTASFWTQTDAFMRKNLTYLRRNKDANCGLISFPIFLCVLFALVQFSITGAGPPQRRPDGSVCEAGKMDVENVRCSIPMPPENVPLLQLPEMVDRAPLGNAATILVTGNNISFGLDLAEHFFPRSSSLNSSDIYAVFGSGAVPGQTMFVDPAFLSGEPIYKIQHQCGPNTTANISSLIGSQGTEKEVKCVQGLCLWLNRSSQINDEPFRGYWNGNEVVAAYDFLNSNDSSFNVSIWYNSTLKENKISKEGPRMLRVARAINLASNAYLEYLRGPGFKILFEFVKEMPKHPSFEQHGDLSSYVGKLFFTWIVLLPYPVILASLVYEKQENLRIMMKMHGLGDGPYWLLSYIYFIAISSAYMLCFVGSCSILGLEFFTDHDYSLQFVFYFVYLNLQIAFAFLAAGIFSKMKTASDVAYIVVFGTGLLGEFYFKNKVADTSFPRSRIAVMELYPGLALYRMSHEFSLYAIEASLANNSGMSWEDLNDSSNGMKEVLIIMVVEWFVFLFVSLYVDQVVTSGSGVRKHLLFSFQNFRGKPSSSSWRTCLESDGSRGKPSSFSQRTSPRRHGSRAFDQVEKADIAQEREKVEQLLDEPSTDYAVICDGLKKVYPGMKGNPATLAVRGLSLALCRGECFVMLGPSGSGKTSLMKMMIGLTEPSSGTAFIEGLNIKFDMDRIYARMGVCMQNDHLWEALTATDHLVFYGRLKNLKGSSLKHAVEESLKSFNLLQVADHAVGKYAGCLKRRLSVAISLIGDPKVVYMDEPSAGLDPASRNELWKVVKRAKINKAIIITTHSTEDAEHLCDRLGIFVDGSLQCIGNAKQLMARNAFTYSLRITTLFDYEEEVEKLVRCLSPSGNKAYHISGTWMFELPKNEVKTADVVRAVLEAKFPVQAWSLVDTTLEDVFIKVAREAQA